MGGGGEGCSRGAAEVGSSAMQATTGIQAGDVATGAVAAEEAAGVKAPTAVAAALPWHHSDPLVYGPTVRCRPKDEAW
jgi:hypothetical protein